MNRCCLHNLQLAWWFCCLSIYASCVFYPISKHVFDILYNYIPYNMCSCDIYTCMLAASYYHFPHVHLEPSVTIAIHWLHHSKKSWCLVEVFQCRLRLHQLLGQTIHWNDVENIEYFGIFIICNIIFIYIYIYFMSVPKLLKTTCPVSTNFRKTVDLSRV